MKNSSNIRWDLNIIIAILTLTFGVVVYQVRQDTVQTAQIQSMNETLTEMKNVLKILTGIQIDVSRLDIRVSALERDKQRNEK